MENLLDLESLCPLEDKNKKCTKTKKISISEKAARKVLAPFLRRVKKQSIQKLATQVEDSYQKAFLKTKIKDVISKLTSFCNDSLEIPTVLNETSEILKDVTKSIGVSSYIVDETDEYIYLNPKYIPKNGRHTVKYKIGPGSIVAAFVAQSQEFVMLDDVLGDPRFPQGIPGTGKIAKAVLCVPVLTSAEGKCIAVIELFRDVSQDSYSALDLQICVSMTGWMGAAIHQNNERLFLLKKSELGNYLTSLVEFFFDGTIDFDKFVSSIIECAKVTVQAERGSFYVMEEEVDEGTEDEIVADVYEEGIGNARYTFKKKHKQRFSKNSLGIAGLVAREGKIINISEAYGDPRFNKDADMHGFLTKSVVSIPLKGSRGVLGVLQLVNKLQEPSFTIKDEFLLRTVAGYASLACQHGNIKEQVRKLSSNFNGTQELLKVHLKPCPEDLRFLRYSLNLKKSDLPKGFFNFDWVITGKEDQGPNYAVYMFMHILGEHYFDYYKLTEFILSVKKSYRENPYHNFSHAFTVCHCMFNILQRNKESFNELQLLALMISTICHDSDHIGYTNNFLEMTNHWLVELYWESPLEHHHYDICILMIEGSGLLSNLLPEEISEVYNLIKFLILATDLVQHFRNRNQMSNLLKNKTFDWNNRSQKLLFLSIVMTVCDLSGMCKPFYTAKKIIEGLYREFYNQGDMEKLLGFSPLTMMDREKTSTIPENQVQFLSLVCIPSVEILVAVFPNTEDLLSQCEELKECWAAIQAKKVVEVWKMEDCHFETKGRRRSNKRVILL